MAQIRLDQWLFVVPARLKSERLTQKPLRLLGGKPLIERVYDNLRPLLADGAQIVVALDSDEVREVCSTKKIPWTMTRPEHPSGTDRCNEVAQQFHRPFIMNVQGDEPFVNLDDLRALAHAVETQQCKMATLGFSVKRGESNSFQDPNCVKIVRTADGRAIYFSRAPVPFDREGERAGGSQESFWQHLGVYAFRRDSLAAFCAMPPSPLERLEKLEQLRAIEAGWTIYVVEASSASIGIDTHEDLMRAEELLAQL